MLVFLEETLNCQLLKCYVSRLNLNFEPSKIFAGVPTQPQLCFRGITPLLHFFGYHDIVTKFLLSFSSD